jgi:phosphoglycerate kinase
LDIEGDSSGNLRLKSLKETIDYLSENKAKVLIIGHKGRPEGKRDENLSLEKILPSLEKVLERKITFFENINDVKDYELGLLENLRFDKGEEENNIEFAKKLSSLGEVYVNEAFAASHRKHASIAELPKLLPHAAGLRFEKEVENINKLLDSPQKPFITLLSGFKKDKLGYLEGLKGISDKVLIGGRLPEYLGDNTVSVRSYGENEEVIIGNLSMDKEDLTLNTVEKFESEIEKAKTVLLVGPLGKFEEEGHRQATERIFRKITEGDAFKVAGGGDTLEAISLLNLSDKFNWLSVGGGAMLEFLTKGTLPGIVALLN